MIDFALVTLDGTKFKHEVYEVIIPTPQGYMAVLPYHIPLVSLVSHGVVSVRQKKDDRDDQMELYAVGGGVIDIEKNRVRVLVDSADHSDEINEQAAQKAFEQAKQLVREAPDRIELDKAQSLLEHHSTQLKVAELRRHRSARS